MAYVEAYRSIEISSQTESIDDSYRGGPLNCSAFCQSKMYPGEYKLSSWTVDPQSLQAIIVKDLFWGDNNRFEAFVDDQVRVLELFRKYFYNCQLCKGCIEEEEVFQPIFQIFLKCFLDALHPVEDAKHLENLMANAHVLKRDDDGVRNVYGDAIQLSGRTDVMVMKMHPLSTAHHKHIPRNSVCHIDLKVPYTAGTLHRSHSQSSIIEQLMAKTDCISVMRNANTVGGVDKHRNLSVGAMTDLFVIYVMYHDRRGGNREFYVTTTDSIEPRSYIQRLLTLCLSAKALASITTTTSIIPDEAPVSAPPPVVVAAADGGTGHDENNDDDDDDGGGGGDDDNGTQDASEEEEGDSDGCGNGHQRKVMEKVSREIDVCAEIYFKEQDARKKRKRKLAFIRDCEMPRLGITLTISNIIAHGGDRDRYYASTTNSSDS